MIKKPIPIFFNLDGKQSVQSVSAVIHIDDNRTEALDLSLLQGGEHMAVPEASDVTARFVRVKDKILISDNVPCAVQENGNILIPIDNAAAKMLTGEIKIEVNIVDDNDILTMQFPLVIRVNNTILSDAEISPESEGTIPELLEEAKQAALGAQHAAEEATQALDSKQDKLKAGENITIEDNVISATSGTDDYNDLGNKPSINGVTLSGDKTSDDLGLQNPLIDSETIEISNNVQLNVKEKSLDFRYLTQIMSDSLMYSGGSFNNTTENGYLNGLRPNTIAFVNWNEVKSDDRENLPNSSFNGFLITVTVREKYLQIAIHVSIPKISYIRYGNVTTGSIFPIYNRWQEIGKDGVSVTNAEINSEGHLIITLSDGTEIDAGAVGTPKTDIANAVVTLSSNSFVYDGTSKAPTVSSVVLNGQTLIANTDYTIIASPAANAGTYIVSVNGIGDYTGVVTANWTITKAQAEIYGDDSIAISGLDEPVSKTYTTNGDGAFSFTISGNIATINNSGGTVTITPTAYGAATMTVTVAEGTNYLGATKTVSVTVEEAQTVFGVVWDYSLSSPQLVRLTPQTDPLGVVTNVPSQEPTACIGNDGNGQSDFDNYMPWKGMNRYNYVNGQVVDFVDYSNGETFVFIPEFWSKIVDDSENSKMYFYISSAELEGFTKHFGSDRYISRYECNENFLSVSGYMPKVNTLLTDFRTGITSIDSNHFQDDFHTYNARILLYIVEFANLNSQDMIGLGITADTQAHISGGTDTLTYHTGRQSGTDNQCSVQYRWIENLWGNLWNWIDGVLLYDGKVYICNEPTKYSDSITNDYIDTNIIIPVPGGNNYIKTENCYNNQYLIPKNNGGSSSTFLCDKIYFAYGLKGTLVGGSFNNNNANAGLFCWNGDAALTANNNYLGSRSILILGGDS